MHPLTSLIWSKTSLAIALYFLVILALGAFVQAQINALESLQYARPGHLNLR